MYRFTVSNKCCASVDYVLTSKFLQHGFITLFHWKKAPGNTYFKTVCKTFFGTPPTHIIKSTVMHFIDLIMMQTLNPYNDCIMCFSLSHARPYVLYFVICPSYCVSVLQLSCNRNRQQRIGLDRPHMVITKETHNHTHIKSYMRDSFKFLLCFVWQQE